MPVARRQPGDICARWRRQGFSLDSPALPDVLARARDPIGLDVLGARLTALKYVFSWLPSQKGFVAERPQRQRAIVSVTS